MKKNVLAILLALCLCAVLLPTSALAADDGFVVSNGVLTAYNGPGGHVTIPSTVKEIRGFAPYQDQSITSVTIPSSVTRIGNNAFQGLQALTEITIPDSVTFIGSYAFQDCRQLAKATLPATLDLLDSYAFADCPALTGVTLPGTVKNMSSNVFSNTPWVKAQGEFPTVDGILYAYNGNGSNVTVPQGVTKIVCTFEEAFAESSPITSITIPEGVTDICPSAFMSCVSLKNVTLPSTLKHLGSSAFWGCTALESVVLPNGLTALEDQMFWGCTALKDVTIPSSVASIDSLCFVSDSSYKDGHMTGIPLSGITIHGAAGSAAERFAKHTGYSFVADQSAVGLPAKEGTAYPATQTVTVVDTHYDETLAQDVTTKTPVTFYCYALKDPATGYLTNYVKLRDVAKALDGTLRGFNVSWDGAISIVDGDPYQPNGTEMLQSLTGEQPYVVSEMQVNMYSLPVILDSILLTDANGGGHTYVKLRDLGRVINFNVAWRDGGIVIDTWDTYTDAD